MSVELKKEQNIQLYQWQVYFLLFTLERSWMNRQINLTKTASKIQLREFTLGLFHSFTCTDYSEQTPLT